MRKFFVVGLLMAGMGLLWAPPTQAISLGFDPSVQTVNVGDEVWVDVNISGLEVGGFQLGEIVSAFDLDVMYDSAVLAATGVTFGTELENWFGLPGFSFQDSDISMPGVVDFAELSLIGDDDLDFLQGDSFTLASLHFTAVGAGWSDLTFVPDPVFGIDVKGWDAAILGLSVGTAQVHVDGAVPEPASLLLFGTGMLGLMGYGWRRKKHMA